MQANDFEVPDPIEGGEFDFVDGAPWLAGFDQLSFEEPVDRLGQSLIVGVTNGAGRCLHSQACKGNDSVVNRDETFYRQICG